MPSPLPLSVSRDSIVFWDFLARTKLIPGYVRHSSTAAVQRGAQGALSLSHCQFFGHKPITDGSDHISHCDFVITTCSQIIDYRCTAQGVIASSTSKKQLFLEVREQRSLCTLPVKTRVVSLSLSAGIGCRLQAVGFQVSTDMQQTL